MWNEIAAWQEKLVHRPDVSAKTIALYTQDARRFATWLQSEHPGLKVTEITSIDAKTYRDHLLAQRFAPATINRALISLMLFFDTIENTNPFRNLTMIEISEPAPVALSKLEWNAIRRCAEQRIRRDHGLALALATLFRYAGPRVSEVAVSPDTRCPDFRSTRTAHYSARERTQASRGPARPGSTRTARCRFPSS